MNEFDILICVAVLIGLGIHTFRQRRQKRAVRGLPHLERAIRGRADSDQRLELADALAKSVIRQARALKKPPLFITASGDLYDDFFPPREALPGGTPEQYANRVLADCVSRYREARNSRNMADMAEFPAYALCAGAGLAVSAFRRLGDDSRDMRDLAEFLAPAPEADDWDRYAEYYREAGLLLGIPRARIDAGLMKRRRLSGNGAGNGAGNMAIPLQ